MIFMKRMADLQLQSTVAVNIPSEETPLNAHEKDILTEAQGRILLYFMEGPLSFGATKGIVRRLVQSKEHDSLVLDLSGVPSVDFTSSMASNDMICDTLTNNGRFVFIVGLHPPVKQLLEKQGVLNNVGKGHIYPQRHTALYHAARVINIEPDACK